MEILNAIESHAVEDVSFCFTFIQTIDEKAREVALWPD
jgi:hypothetical protein